MPLTLDEFFDSHQLLKSLRDNLEVNLKVLAPDLNQEDKAALMRANLIMIRQCLQGIGDEQ